MDDQNGQNRENVKQLPVIPPVPAAAKTFSRRSRVRATTYVGETSPDRWVQTLFASAWLTGFDGLDPR
jgi:hypothetical protein